VNTRASSCVRRARKTPSNIAAPTTTYRGPRNSWWRVAIGCFRGSHGRNSGSITSGPFLRRCADRGDFQRGIDLTTRLIWYWITRAATEGARWLDELLDGDTEPVAHPWAYFARGFLAVLQNDPADAGPALERGATAARAAGYPEVLAESLAMASIAANMAGDLASSRRLLDEAQVVADGLNGLGTRLLMYQARALNGLLDGDLDAVRSAAADVPSSAARPTTCTPSA